MCTKVCLSCKHELPLSEFGINGPSSSGKKRWKPRCKKCQVPYEMDIFRQKLTEAVGGIGNLKCSRCGYDRSIAALEFHHIDPTTKERNISKMQNYSYKAIKAEVDKCILLCANCHREEHESLRNNAAVV